MKHLGALDALFLQMETAAIADRLAQREGRWQAFHREGWRRWLCRDPYRADG
ncbi:MAG: hypothetical protein ABIR98_10350 [Usitatibacter sp.]